MIWDLEGKAVGFKWFGRVKEKRKGTGWPGPSNIYRMNRVEHKGKSNLLLLSIRKTDSVPTVTTVAHLGLEETPSGCHHLPHS